MLTFHIKLVSFKNIEIWSINGLKAIHLDFWPITRPFLSKLDESSWKSSGDQKQAYLAKLNEEYG